MFGVAYQTSSGDVKWATGFTDLKFREQVRTTNINVVVVVIQTLFKFTCKTKYREEKMSRTMTSDREALSTNSREERPMW